MFTINPMDGWIRARVSFDREVRSEYSVKVIARDYGSTPRSSTATVVVTIIDVNESPEFTAAYKNLKTEENIPLGKVIGQVWAIDNDQGMKLFVSFLFLLLI